LICLGLWTASARAPDQGSLKEADDAIIRFMQDHEIHAATLAVSRNGKLLHERGFGFADPAFTTPLSPTVRMRIASVSKPITAAALRHLVREDKLKLSDPVLKYLPPTRYPVPSDARWRAITVGEVLQHMGGWDRSLAGDPMFKHRVIMKDLHIEALTPKEVVRWMMTQPLQFSPGTKSVYSNFGYCLLGVIIEEIAGCSYGDFVKRTVGHEAGMSSLAFSGTRPDRRLKDEIWYDFGTEGEHFLIEPMEAHGGWICTAADLTRFLDKYWMNGEPRNGGHGNWFFFGSLPGTTAVAVQRADGINYALLMNKRDSGDGWHGTLKSILDKSIPQQTP
jgi:CubicO group peptidase (beta-lactamase class C family)